MKRWQVVLGVGVVGYAVLYRWANREAEPCSECGAFCNGCPACTGRQTWEPDWLVMAVYWATSPRAVVGRVTDTEWWEGSWETWPHCCTQGGCGMHHIEPFCRCGCWWCRAAQVRRRCFSSSATAARAL